MDREQFIKEIEEILKNQKIKLSEQANKYFELLKNGKQSLGGITENGKAILQYCQANWQYNNNIFTSKNISDGIQIPARSVSGSIRKLVADGYIQKINSSPVSYSITEHGKEFSLEK